MKMLIVILSLLTCGCAPALRPDYATVAAVHGSQPGHGPWAQPFGDHGASAETNWEGVEAALRWEEGPWFAEASATWLAHRNNVAGGPWLTGVRLGARFRLPRSEP